MTRPVFWAAMVAIVVAIAATRSGTKLASYRGSSASDVPVAVSTENGLQVVFVDGDLGGHFTLHPMIDGRRISMLVDTGATIVALRHEDAVAAGFQPKPTDFTQRISSANGVVAGAPVRIKEIKVGAITVRNVDAIVMPPGRLGISLLGMSFLKRLGGFEIQHGRLKLQA